MFTKIEKLTKQIYTSQHLNFSIGKDKSIFNRFLNHVKQPSYYSLTKNFFKGKSVLDVGCGNTASSKLPCIYWEFLTLLV